MAYGFNSRNLLTYFLSILLAFPPNVVAGIASDSSTEGDVASQLHRLDQFSQYVKEMRSHIDRSQFDISQIVEELDFDAVRIIDFVTKQIHFQPYPGLLRGAQGTLMSRAGNSLDQSLLLATLLKDAGYDARIVRSRISTNIASELVGTLKLGPRRQAAIGDEEALRDVMHRLLVNVSGLSDEEASKQVAGIFGKPTQYRIPDFVKQDAQFVIGQVDTRFTDENRSMSALVEEARDYFWVEWQDGPGSEWQGTHPAFGGTPPDQSFANPIEFYVDEIPADNHFKFRVEVILEQRLGNKTTKANLASTSDRPTANLVGQTISVALAPNSIATIDDVNKMEESLNKATLWIPMINGAPGALAFDYLGNTVDTIAAGAPGAGLFQSVGGNFLSAAGALSGKSPEESLAGIENLWIDYVVTHPVSGERRHRTDLLAESLIKLPKDSDNWDLRRKGLLSSVHTAMLAVGDYPAAYVFDRSLERMLDVVQFAKTQISQGTESWHENLADLNTDFIGHLDFFEAVDSALAGTDSLSYRPAPGVLVFSQAMYPPDEALAILNILDSPRRSIVKRDGELSQSPEENILAGVWESTLEGLMLGSADRPTFSAAYLLNRLAAENEQFSLLDDGAETKELAPLSASPAGHWVRDDLSKERLVLIPSADLNSPTPSTSWWRIDRTTGETLAVMAGGYGVAMTEDVIFKITLGVSFIAFLAAFYGCMGGANPDASQPKAFSCTICGLFAFVTTYLAVSAMLTQGPALITAWRSGEVVTITIETTAGAQVKEKALEAAGILMGVFCGVASVAD